ncbi:hypothetical protein ZWY2020_042249 [Hordeum vulgare]|nr:hypothetical protein ZWY2020_042249 [Hordeum vulgare]
MLEVEHPAAKILVELAELQYREVGDGTTYVIIIAAELLKSANELVRNKIHPTSIISGSVLAMREACKYVEEKLSVKVDKLGKDSLVNCAKTSMSSKLIHSDKDFFANLVADALTWSDDGPYGSSMPSALPPDSTSIFMESEQAWQNNIDVENLT